MPSHEVTGEVIGPSDTTIVGPQIAAQAWSSEEPPTEPEQTEHEHGWSLTWQYATALLSSGIVLAIVIWAVFYVISPGGDPTPSVPTPHTSATTPTTTPTTASQEERTARFNQAFQAVYAKPGETEPRLQDALIDDHHVLKIDLRAASTVISQLRAQGIWISIDWSTGAITEVDSDNQTAFDDLERYFNLKLTPEEYEAVSGPIRWQCPQWHPPGVTTP
jgi:hypothetical protein